MTDRDHGRFREALALSGIEGGMVVVDWGCAHGWFAALVADRFPATRVIACDIPYPAGAPGFTTERIRYHVLDEQSPSLPIEDASVDRIFALDVLEHMGPVSLAGALAEMHRLLKADGRLVVTVPHKGVLHWADVENLRMRLPRLHKATYQVVRGTRQYREKYGETPQMNFSQDAVDHHHYGVAELAELLSGSGFIVRRIRWFGMLYIVPWSLFILLEWLRRVTGKQLVGAYRAAWKLYSLLLDVHPPAALADNLAVAASPADPAVLS